MRQFALALMAILLSVASSAHAVDYRLGSGDVVKINVFDHPELQMETRVDEQGKINFPLIGGVPVAGETLGTAQKRIEEGLIAGGYLKNPQVNLIVSQYRSKQVSVLGQVNRPGKYPLESTSTVTDLLAQAGGVTLAGADNLVLIRQQEGKSQNIPIDTDTLFRGGQTQVNHQVSDGDVIYVPRAPVFYIYGEVQKPGAYRLERNMNVMQVISLGGGITPRGTQRGIQIRRRGTDGQALNITGGLNDPVYENDVVYVKESLF